MRGLTLVEVLVAAALALLVGLLGARMLAGSMRMTARTQGRADLQQTITLAVLQLRNDLQMSNAAGLSFYNADATYPGTIVAVQPLLTEGLQNRPLYGRELRTYSCRFPEGRLIRQRWESVPGVTLEQEAATRLTIGQLRSIPTLTTAKETRIVARDVTKFQISSGFEPPNIGNPLRLHLTGTRAPDTFSLDQTVFLRNDP